MPTIKEQVIELCDGLREQQTMRSTFRDAEIPHSTIYQYLVNAVPGGSQKPRRLNDDILQKLADACGLEWRLQPKRSEQC